MHPTPDTQIRELDRRRSDGIEVKLLWNPRRNRVSVAVEDERHGEVFEFEPDSADALAAFHHPYAYADARPGLAARRRSHQGEGPEARAA
jgi:hypothetical protein